MQVVSVTNDSGALLAPEWLPGVEAVHRQLRPHLPDDYAGLLATVFANGARMAIVVEGNTVLAVAVWRVLVSTYEGARLFVDDLVSDEKRRSQGAGKCLLGWLEQKAVSMGCTVLTLDSGVQRSRAHRFYFREGMHVSSFCFRKALK